MKSNILHAGRRRPQGILRNSYFIALLLIGALVVVPFLIAQTPQANTQIGNQASATFTDGSGIARTATSNLVKTIVQQVASLTLTANGTKTGTPGSQVVYPHTLTNTGNGADSFTLTLATSGTVTMLSTAIYADLNGDGIADNAVNLVGTNVAVAYGGTYSFVVVGTIPAGATSAQTGVMTPTATSVFSGAATASNTDTTTVTGNAVINTTKTLSVGTGPSPSAAPVSITLTYTNNGNAIATAVKFIDAIPAGMTYVAGSGRWSVTGATALTDASDGVQPAAGSPNIDYSLTGSTITAIVNSVAPGASGTLTFQVNVAAGLVPGPITNTATYQYNDGSANVGPFNTNGAVYVVQQTAAVAFTNGAQVVASASQGATISFTNTVKNNGNGNDVFNISLSGSTYPAGTTFQLFKSDGVTPLVDTNGPADGISDTGPLASLASYNVIVKAILPSGVSGGGPYAITVTATSTANGVINAGVSATTTDTLTTIAANTVDATDNTARSDSIPAGTAASGNAATTGFGVQPTGEAAAVVTNVTNPGTTSTFTVFVNNTSTVADNYNLAAAQNGAISTAFPAGWSVAFRASVGGACASLGVTITNTGNISSLANLAVCAVVTIPASYAPGTVPVFIQALSPTSGAADVIHNAITVNTVHSVSLAPANTGQIFPGGSANLNHTLTNNGNVTETFTFPAGFATDNQAAWSSTLYDDSTGTTVGVLDAGDTAISSASTFILAPGATRILIDKVASPSSAPTGQIDVSSLIVTFNAGSNTATSTDTLTVVAGDVRLNKTQSQDIACTGVPGVFSAADITSGAKPGSCVWYQIVVNNQGTADATAVVVSDSTPSFTTYINVGGTHPATTTMGSFIPALPATGTAGTISAAVGTLAPGQSATITFEVKINP